MSGVVGRRMPRFTLFGELLEVPGTVQLGVGSTLGQLKPLNQQANGARGCFASKAL
jgi:hypothetical protein